MMVYAVVSSAQIAFNYFIHGEGQIMETAPLPLYGAVMAVLCLGLAFFNRSQYKKTNSTSTMLRAEAQTNLIDGLQSAAIDKSFRYLKKQGLDLRVDLTALQSEFDTLEKSVAENNAKLSEVKAELQPLKDVRYWISKVIEPEQGEVEKKPEPKHSVTEKMKYLQEQKKQLEPKSPQHKQKKQNMEL